MAGKRRSEMRRRGTRDYSYAALLRNYRSAVGLRPRSLIGSWRMADRRGERGKHWPAILNGLRAFEELKASKVFTAWRPRQEDK